MMKYSIQNGVCYFGILKYISSRFKVRIHCKNGSEYTAEIWAGVPAIGWSTVKQDFKAIISGGKIKSNQLKC